MKIRRNISSIPMRTASETWRAIMDLVTGLNSIDKTQLVEAASIMESLIADETPARSPITFKNSGARIVVYCLYQEDAMEAGLAVDSLTTNPTAGDWRVTAPCEAEDVSWMNNSLKSRASRISVYNVDEEPAEADDREQSANALEIDWGALKT